LPESRDLVLTNAGPLIALGKLNRLTLLTELYGTILVPEAVYQEVVTEGSQRGFHDAFTVRLFLSLHSATIVHLSDEVVEAYSPPVTLGRGERELLALSQRQPNPLVLLDDETARQEARRLGLRSKGTVGVLVQSFRTGLLPRREIELLLTEISGRGDIWISPRLCQQVLAEIRKG
jgi:predicted nucleic acid-binding protein